MRAFVLGLGGVGGLLASGADFGAKPGAFTINVAFAAALAASL